MNPAPRTAAAGSRAVLGGTNEDEMAEDLKIPFHVSKRDREGTGARIVLTRTAPKEATKKEIAEVQTNRISILVSAELAKQLPPATAVEVSFSLLREKKNEVSVSVFKDKTN